MQTQYSYFIIVPPIFFGRSFGLRPYFNLKMLEDFGELLIATLWVA